MFLLEVYRISGLPDTWARYSAKCWISGYPAIRHHQYPAGYRIAKVTSKTKKQKNISILYLFVFLNFFLQKIVKNCLFFVSLFRLFDGIFNIQLSGSGYPVSVRIVNAEYPAIRYPDG